MIEIGTQANAFIVLLRQRGCSVELKDIGLVPKEHLSLCAEVAQKERFDLMFEFSKPPNAAELLARAAHASNDKGIANMVNMEKLWVLSEAGFKDD